MVQYKIQTGYMDQPVAVTIVGENISIPMDPNNTDYQKYLAWLAEGNEPLPPDNAEQSAAPAEGA